MTAVTLTATAEVTTFTHKEARGAQRGSPPVTPPQSERLKHPLRLLVMLMPLYSQGRQRCEMV